MVARYPTLRNPLAALLTGGVSESAPSRWVDGVPGGSPLVCARPSRSMQAAANGDSPLHPVVSARDPLRRPPGWLPVRCARMYASSRQCSYALDLKLRRNDRGGLDMATKYKILIGGEEDDEGNTFDTESEADDYASQWESNWHAGGEVLEMSNPGDYPYDPDDCPSIEVVEFETD